MIITKIQIFEALKKVIYQAQKKNIVDAKMVENLKIEGSTILFDLLLPSGDQQSAEKLIHSCKNMIHTIDGNLTIQIQPKITNEKTLVNSGQELLPEVKNVIAIASGKGGVGKSTIAVNLAVALAKMGLKIGLLDADIYGPSIPKMFQTENEKPGIETINERDIINPLIKYGVKILSIGYFIDPASAAVWRGPMASSALKQLITDTNWGELDYLLIDLPPGTSDIHLTLVQTLAITGAIIVSTPQEVALADAIKGIAMFNSDAIKVPVLGLVENMAWFTPAELPENKYYIFGKDGCKRLSEKTGLPLLGQIPIVQSICESGDNGIPSALDTSSTLGTAFRNLAASVITQVDIRNKNVEPTKKVNVN
jgi:ATP-binding protein involved in chromosome partitioning